MIDFLLHLVFEVDSHHILLALLLELLEDLCPVRLLFALSEEVFLLKLVDLGIFAVALTRSHVAMIILLDIDVFVAEHPTSRDNEHVKDLQLSRLRLILIFALDRKSVLFGCLTRGLNGLDLANVILLLLVDNIDLLRHFQVTFNDKVDFIGAVSLLEKHLVSIQLPRLEHLCDVFEGVTRILLHQLYLLEVLQLQILDPSFILFDGLFELVLADFEDECFLECIEGDCPGKVRQMIFHVFE